MTRVASDRREGGQNGLRSQRLAMPKSLLPVAVPPSFHSGNFLLEIDETSKRRVERDGQVCRPPQALALKINDMPVAMPVRFSTPVELGVLLRSPTRGALMARSHRAILLDYPTRPVSISDLRFHTAEAEGPVRSRLPEASSDLAVRSGNEAFLEERTGSPWPKPEGPRSSTPARPQQRRMRQQYLRLPRRLPGSLGLDQLRPQVRPAR